MKEALNRYMKCYNEERIHGSLDYKTPVKFIEDFNRNNLLEVKSEMINPLLREEVLLEVKTKLNQLNNKSELCQTLS